MRLGVDLTPAGLALRQAPGASAGPEPGFVLDLRTDQHVWDGTPLEGLTALPGWSYSRAGTAWARQADGTYASFPAHTPRRTDMGLWCEPASTNLFARFGPTVGQLASNTNVSVATEPSAPPISGLSWLALNNSGGAAYAYQGASVPAATTCTIQIWVETPDGSAPVVGTNSATGDFCLVLGGGIVSGGLGMEALSGQVWRVWGTTVTGASPANHGGVIRYGGQSVRSLKFCGFQLEVGALATGPIVTTGAVAGRSADVARLTDMVPMSEATLVADFTLNGGGSSTLANARRAACLDDGTATGALEISNQDGLIGARVLTAGVEQARLTGAGVAPSGVGQGVALRSRTNDFRLARNGVLSGADTSGPAPGGLSRLTLGAGGDGTGQLGGCLQRLEVRPVGRADAALVALSA